jgi:hypothetical protein
MIDTQKKKALVEVGEQSPALPDEELVPDYTVPVLLFFGGSVPLAALTQFLGLGAPGFVASAVGAGLLACCAGFLKEKIFDYLPGLRTYGEGMTWGSFFQALGEESMIVDADPVGDPVEERAQPKDASEADEQQRPAPSVVNEGGFVTVDRSSEVPGVPRYTVEEIAEHIQPNSYQLYIGRSLTQPNNPAISISFYRRHLKVIGASQKGKSSMAAALLKIILRTHDEQHVLVALLDIENRTSKLFENDPHIARVRFPGGKETVLHARSKEQVLEHLDLLVEILEYRATMTVAQVKALPLIVIYLEEFLLLKKELKQRAARLTGEAKERAEADYERFVFCVNQLAGRGLKYNLQLLVCAQVDYRDDDLYEAFANITAGFCFCVRATAAASAGFMQTELLNRNAKNNKVGQCVVETPDGHDLILAPEYDLEGRLMALEKQENRSASIYRNPAHVNAETPIYTPVNDAVNGFTSRLEPLQRNQHLHLLVNAETPEIEHSEAEEPSVNVNVNADKREIIRRMVDMGGIPHNKIAKAVGLDGRNYPTYKAVCKEMGIATEREA